MVQETLLRAFASLPKLWQPLYPKAYLFRIATNIWLNDCRKRKIETDSNEAINLIAYYDSDPFIVREAISTLSRVLPPRQAAVFLMIDVFDFRAEVVAEMVGMTEGAVKAVLHRARMKMKTHREVNEQAEQDVTIEYNPIIEAFIEAFSRRDPDGIAVLLSVNATNNIVHVGEEYGRETIRKYSLTGWANDPLPMICDYRRLWGKPVIIVLEEIAGLNKLYTIIELSVAENEIIAKKNYYFCQDLLQAAGEELRLPVHLTKW